jgi:hypothetical protein
MPTRAIYSHQVNDTFEEAFAATLQGCDPALLDAPLSDFRHQHLLELFENFRDDSVEGAEPNFTATALEIINIARTLAPLAVDHLSRKDITRQLEVNHLAGRDDIQIFVNGVVVLVIECKTPAVLAKHGPALENAAKKVDEEGDIVGTILPTMSARDHEAIAVKVSRASNLCLNPLTLRDLTKLGLAIALACDKSGLFPPLGVISSLQTTYLVLPQLVTSEEGSGRYELVIGDPMVLTSPAPNLLRILLLAMIRGAFNAEPFPRIATKPHSIPLDYDSFSRGTRSTPGVSGAPAQGGAGGGAVGGGGGAVGGGGGAVGGGGGAVGGGGGGGGQVEGVRDVIYGLVRWSSLFLMVCWRS